MKKIYPALPQKMGNQKPTYPGLAQKIFEDEIYGPRIQRRVKRLLSERSSGLTKAGHNWYFGYLVCAYTQTHYGIKHLENFTSVTGQIFDLCFVVNEKRCDRIC
ncbi:hypothetical protein LNP18_06480 [Leuconostoc citreum]|uniref:hypothetical protein n=1 Tax=Leuconostoc citreum TaxID=33964 RepID=UPI00200A23B4|nr:hypothetical protein [Leuconostoc citreum]MCK8605750.1 hypothetical protein [Leuconostoc citreum]